MRLLVTDYAWPTLDEEHAVLDAAGGGSLVVASSGDEAELAALAGADGGVDGILTCWKLVTPAVLDAAGPRCRVVSRYGVGVDNIAVAHAASLGMVVTRVPDYCVEEVADHTMALLLGLGRRVVAFDRAVRGGVWDNAGSGALYRVRGQVLGLVGFGLIASAVAARAVAFGLEVVAWVRSVEGRAPVPGVRFTTDLAEVLGAADYVSVHVPLAESTRGLLSGPEFALMKPTAYLVNTSRGAVLDEGELAAALRAGGLAGAGLDVLSAEPPGDDHPLVGLDNVVLTPHAAFSSEESTREVARKATENAVAVLQGRRPPEAYVVAG